MCSLLKPQARTKDRISALPDVLVCHILSLLATKYAVRTTILSKRWKNLWTCVPRLDFSDERDFRINVDGSDRFATFVSRALELHDSDLHKFCLVILYPRDSTRIGDWICSAVRRNVVELDLHIYDETGEMTFQMPECVFTCKTLIAMKLNVWSCYVTVDPPTFGCFPNLKSLHVTVYDPDEDSIEKLFSCCPILEDLTIDGQIEYDTTDIVYSFKVSTLELKTLRIYLKGVDTLVDVYINAPKLENLELQEVGLSNYYLTGSANSLVNASIAFRDFQGEKLPYFSNRAIALMDEVRNVKYLSLSAHFVEDWRLPASGNVNQLRLILWDCSYLKLLAEFLNSAPNLEDFVLEDRTKCDSVLQWNPPKDVPICLSSHLKTISIRGFKGRRIEMEMAKYLLKNGHRLNKMTIYTGFLYTEAEDLYREFLMFHRAATCQVEFIKMHY